MANIQQPEFGRRLRRLRLDRDLSQRDLAVGVVNPSYISLLESGSRVPTLEVAIQLARVLGVGLGELVEGAVPPVEPAVAPTSGARGGSEERLVRDLLARHAYESGDLAEARQRFGETYRHALGRNDLVEALSYGLDLQDVLVRLGETAARRELLDELAKVAERLGAPEAVVRVQVDRAAAARDAGHMVEALDLAEEAVSAIGATALAGTGEHVRTLGVLISIRCDSGDFRDISRLVGEMMEIAEALASPPLSGRAHWVAAVALGRLGKSDLAASHVHQARELLAVPATSVQDWARFSRAATSALLEASADPAQVLVHLEAARAASAITESGKESVQLASLECRYALLVGDYERAVRLSDFIDQGATDLVGVEQARLRRARGRALKALGRVEEAAVQIRAAAVLCDEVEAYRMAAQLWRELAELNT
ncbi:helix-turn-helix domain-containing protein [Saccharothrix sp. S26]|uniref:helix-turn-helix domain-containing protein n=1 Tax=Saccharothrix sp. S26 TaxID=2907215 RepID=UPI001F4792EC|nr:helix-turn-helix transcriptional regulator [Saccharothrix sp. S26]MCE6995148.1 helix-turn-helix domain-containing protein [Saccharothrix sp. S26]